MVVDVAIPPEKRGAYGWYRLQMKLERQLAASFPRPGDDESAQSSQ